MSFVRKIDDILQKRKERETADFGSAEMMNVFWETKAEIIEKLLPPPLKIPKLSDNKFWTSLLRNCALH